MFVALKEKGRNGEPAACLPPVFLCPSRLFVPLFIPALFRGDVPAFVVTVVFPAV